MERDHVLDDASDMIGYQAVFAHIHFVFEAEQVGHFPFRTLAQPHLNSFRVSSAIVFDGPAGSGLFVTTHRSRFGLKS